MAETDIFEERRIYWINLRKGAFPINIIILAAVGVVLLLLLMMDKKQIQNGAERLSIFWFRLAFAFLILFAMNIAGGFIGIYVPVNIASGMILAILGIPGFVSLCTLAIFL